MDIKALEEVDLRAATAPLNRAGTAFLPSVRTAAQLRERARLQVLDLKLSRAAVLSAGPDGEPPQTGGCCLIERDGDEAFVVGVSAEPLMHQRGGWVGLVEAALAAAAKAGVRRVTAEASEHDPGQLGGLQAARFSRARELARYTLPGAPNRSLVPEDLGDDSAAPAPAGGGRYARAVSIDVALPLLQTESPTFGRRPEVLRKLAPLYTVRALFEGDRPVAAVVVERERKLLVALGGEPEAAAQLAALAAARYEARFVDAVPEGDPMAGPLEQAGFQRAAVRVELARTL
jgi:hypothetical protein